jgi:hypothetical protein
MGADDAAKDRGDRLALGAGHEPVALGKHELHMALELLDRDRPK